MKNKNRTKLAVIVAVAVITAGLAVQSARAVSTVGYTLNLTEVSSTVLNVSYNGPSAFSILNTGTDMWTLSRTSGAATFNANFVADWQEPEEPGEVNEVRNPSYSPSTTLFIVSDLSIMNYYGDLSTTFPDGALVQAGTDNGQPLFLRFVDQAAQAEAPAVPEGGSSFALLALTSGGLFAARRRFRKA